MLALEDGAADVDAGAADLPMEIVAAAVEGGMPVFGGPGQITLRGKTVRFDNFSHASGHQRGYISCCNRAAHGPCYRYSQVNLHGSHKECAAWLFAWDAAGHTYGMIKEEHKGYKPPPDILQRVLDAMP